MNDPKTLRGKIAQRLVEHVKPILMMRWEATVRHLQTECNQNPSEDSLQKAFMKGCSTGYWNGVTDGIDVGFDLGKQENPVVQQNPLH